MFVAQANIYMWMPFGDASFTHQRAKDAGGMLMFGNVTRGGGGLLQSYAVMVYICGSAAPWHIWRCCPSLPLQFVDLPSQQFSQIAMLRSFDQYPSFRLFSCLCLLVSRDKWLLGQFHPVPQLSAFWFSHQSINIRTSPCTMYLSGVQVWNVNFRLHLMHQNSLCTKDLTLRRFVVSSTGVRRARVVNRKMCV